MSRTQRCIVCSEQGIVNPLWSDEVCAACGRCVDHCYDVELVFSPRARSVDDRPHPDAGKRRTVAFVQPPRDPDRSDAELPL